VLAGVLGSREAGRVHCVEDVIRLSGITSSLTRPASLLLKTPASTSSAENHMQNIQSSAPEDGHNDARNMLS